MYAGLPRCHAEDFLIWNEKRKMVGGWLKKRAGGKHDKPFGSLFNKGTFQRRWFIIDTEITGQDNYELSYFYTPDDSKPRARYPLHHAKVLYSGGDAFQIQLADGQLVHLSTEREDVKNKWYETLVRVIKIASAREEAIEKRLETNEKVAETPEKVTEEVDDHDDEFTGFDEDDGRAFSPERDSSKTVGAGREPRVGKAAKKGTSRAYPSLRLDVDIATIPPSSTQRRQFEEMFASDVANALELQANQVEIHSVKPVVIMSWLVEVTFDIVLDEVSREDLDIDEDEDDYDVMARAIQEEREARYDALMVKLHGLVTDITSPIYNGFQTCKLDPSYTSNMVRQKAGEVEIFSSERAVLDVMHRYKDVHLPSHYEEDDPSHFQIILLFEGAEYPIDLPNTAYMRQRHCNLWPFEVKQVIGLTDTMQEQWVEPVALNPVDVPRASSHSVRFEPSCRMGGQVCLNTSRLQAGVTYEVEVDDLRSEVLMNLTDEEMYTINETFKTFDVNNDGTVQREEIEQLVRERTKGRKDVIEEKFQARISEPGISQDEIEAAEEAKRQHLQACNEAQVKQLKMLTAADINSDGMLSLTEFMLAESWWLRCTLNPAKAHLF
jgi:Ca2+-binding EF-hand superfamily protein